MTTDLLTLAAEETSVRWREPYVSSGLNRKDMAVRAPGVYRGFRLTTHASVMTVTIEADAVAGDHVAVYQQSDGYTLTVRRTGAIALSLAAFSSQGIYIVLKSTYVPGVSGTTTTVIATYTAAELLAALDSAYLIVLGYVVVPASSIVITSDLITPNKRVMAWERAALEAVTWPQVLVNGSFEDSSDGAAVNDMPADGWRHDVDSGDGRWLSKLVPSSGLRSMAFVYGTGASTAQVRQSLMLPVTSGQRIRLKYSTRCVVVTTGGVLQVALEFVDAANSIVATEGETIQSTLIGAYDSRELWTTVPAGAVRLREIRFESVAATSAAADGTALVHIDGVGLWAEPVTPNTEAVLSSAMRPVLSTAMVLRDPSQALTAPGMALRMESDELQVDRLDGVGTAIRSKFAGAIGVGTRLSNITAATAPLTNTLYPKSIVKSHGTLVTDGSTTQTFTTAAMDGFNYTASWLSNTKVRVTFVTAMADALYGVTTGNMGATSGAVKVSGRTTTRFDMELIDMAGVAVDLTLAVEELSFAVYGRQ